MALAHDICEYAKGDIDSLLIRIGKVSKEEKERREERAMNLLKEKYSFAKEIYNLWKEYEKRETREAKYVKAIDKLEALTHMIEKDFVGNEDDSVDHLHAALYVDDAVKNFPELKRMLKEIKIKLKVIFEKQNLNWKPEFENFP